MLAHQLEPDRPGHLVYCIYRPTSYVSQVKNYVVVETACIVIIFVISGLALKTEEIMYAIKHPAPLIYGLVAILGVTPCLAFVTIRLPLHPSEFVIGAPSDCPYVSFLVPLRMLSASIPPPVLLFFLP